MKHLLHFIILLIFSQHAFATENSLAQHLLYRSGFSSDALLLKQIQPLPYPLAVDFLLSKTRNKAISISPNFVSYNQKKRYKSLSRAEKKQRNQQHRRQMDSLKGWWINEMIVTDSPLTESMTLFWHNHFTSSAQKVRSVPLMYQQNVLLRRHALGNFSTLLHAAAKDPAMVLYLDNSKNRKGSPNENFAREVMELLTVGEGNYSENDIKQAAIAFTGWSVNRKTGNFLFRQKLHDSKSITLLGQTINERNVKAGEEVLNLLLEQPQTALYLSTKLYKHFISHDDIDAKTIQHLALILRNNNYDIKPWLRALFLSDAFKQQQGTGSLIKSPIDLIVGTFRSLNLPAADPTLLAKASKKMGQDILNPPNVKGWPGGKHWINTHTFLIRKNMLSRFLREQKMKGMINMDSMQNTPQLLITSQSKNSSLRSQILDPAYQVK